MSSTTDTISDTEMLAAVKRQRDAMLKALKLAEVALSHGCARSSTDEAKYRHTDALRAVVEAIASYVP